MSISGNDPRSTPAKPPLTPADDRQWAFVAHCGGILGCVPSAIIFYLLRDRGPFTAQESREALNFTLPPTLLAIVLNVVGIIVSALSPGSGSPFILLALLIWVALTVSSVIAAVQVNKNQPYRYRWNLRLLK